MKKDVPNIIKLDIPYDRESLEGILLWRYSKIIEDEYTFAPHDFNLYCAILIRKLGLEKIPEEIKSYAIQKNSIRPEVQFQKTALAIKLGEEITENERELHYKEVYKRAIEKINIVKQEIKRTSVNPSKVSLSNSHYYRELLNIIKEFDDITLIDWFIPIVLKFEKFVHIYVKHVEETKFSDGQFRKRSLFDYKHTEIFTLIKKILKQEEQNIKEHFLEVSIGHSINYDAMIKDYHRGFRKFKPVMIGNDKFRLTIDKYGIIQSFYQIK